MITKHFPGKLFLMGEYAAIVPGNTSIIAAINRFLTVKIEHSDSFHVTSKYGCLDDASLQDAPESMRFVKEAVSVAREFSNRNTSFRMTIESQLEENNIKYGFGSSGVVVVAVIASILDLYDVKYTKLILFKLAMLAQVRLGLNGSGGDIASTIYGGIIAYTRFDNQWLALRKENISVVNSEWPLLNIETLDPTHLKFYTGWTRTSNATSPFVSRFEDLMVSNPDHFSKLNERASNVVQEFIVAVKTQNKSMIADAVGHYRTWMKELGEHLEISIETESLKQLIDTANQLGYSAKISGSGGGDCGIVFDLCNDFENIEKLRNAWLKHGILMLDVEVI